MKKLLFAEKYLQNNPDGIFDIRIGEVSMTEVDWWYLYQKEILVVDTLLIENFYASINENHVSNITYIGDLPIKEVKAKILIIKGDSLAYIHGNDDRATCGPFKVVKSNVELSLDDLELKDILSDVDFTSSSASFGSKENNHHLIADSISYGNNILDLFSATFSGQGIKLEQSKIQMEIDALKLLQAAEPILLKRLSIDTKGLAVAEDFDVEKLSKLSNNSIKSIDDFQFKSNKVEYNQKIQGEKRAFVASSLQIRKSNVDAINFEKNLKGLNFSLTKMSLMSEIDGLDMEADRVNFSGSRMSLRNGEAKLDEKDGVQFSFTELDLFGLNLEEIIAKNLNLDSIYLDVRNAKVGESLVEDWTESLDLPFEDIRIGTLAVTGNDLKVDMSKREDINIVRFISKVLEISKSKSSEFKFDSYGVDLVDVRSHSEDKSLLFKAGRVSIQDGQMKLSKIKVDPGKYRSTSSNTIYKMSVPSIVLSMSDLQSYLNNERLEFEKLLVADLKMEITTDENISKNNDYKESLSEMILNLGISIDIEQVDMRRADFTFRYRPKDDESFSVIYFDNMDLNIKNLCNQKSKLRGNSKLALEGEASFMSKTDFKIDAIFDLLDPQFAYEYKLELGSMEFSEVNEMLTDLAGLKIKKGKLDKLLCNVRADKFQSKGTLDFYYRNLKVRFDQKKFIEKWNPVNFMITRFVLNKNNREEWEHETGLINIKRDPSRTMYFQMWEAVFDGMKYVMKPEF